MSAECAEGDVGEISIVGAIGDTTIVAVQHGKDRQLMRTDGTPAGTRPMTSVAFRGLPDHGVQVGDTLYFVARDRSHGREPWRTDGTHTGTMLLKDIRAGREGSSGSMAAVGPTLYLAADDGEHGTELWRSDGSPDGTTLVKDILPGGAGSISARAASIWFESGATVLDGAILFAADDGERGLGLWRSDGTPEGTFLVRAFPPQATARPAPEGSRERAGRGRTKSSGLAPLVTVGETLYFSVGPVGGGGELWRTDGTAEGTNP